MHEPLCCLVVLTFCLLASPAFLPPSVLQIRQSSRHLGMKLLCCLLHYEWGQFSAYPFISAAAGDTKLSPPLTAHPAFMTPFAYTRVATEFVIASHMCVGVPMFRSDKWWRHTLTVQPAPRLARLCWSAGTLQHVASDSFLLPSP